MRYVLASTPRSGSNLLTRGLWSSGRAGLPTEYLSIDNLVDWTRREGLAVPLDGHWADLLPELVGILQRKRTSPNGVFGVKVHSLDLLDAPLAGVDLHRLLQSPTYLWLERTNRYRQAISYLIAQQTGLWVSDALGLDLPLNPSPEPPTYDFDALVGTLDSINQGYDAWADYFHEHAITPAVVTYEQIVADYEGTIASCLDAIGVGGEAHHVEPTVRRQATGVNDAWLARFVDDLGRHGHAVETAWLRG